MKKAGLVSSVVVCLLGLSTSSVLADYEVKYVGDNPFSGFPNSGGTGDFNGNTIEKTFTTLGVIPIIIGVVSDSTAPGAEEILHIDERVRNDTGVNWTDFHFLMQPIDANPGLKVDFLNIINPTGEWTSIQPNTNFLSLFGSVPDGGIFSLSFDLKITSPAGAYNLFGIHEFPSVPSPSASTLALIGCSLVTLSVRRSGPRGSITSV